MGVTVSKNQTRPVLDTTTPPPGAKQANGKVANGPPQYHKSQSHPPPRPPITTKDEIFKVENYRHVASHVMNAPRKMENGTFRELVQYLTSNPEWDDIAKVRAIFLWITSIDVYNLTVDEEPAKQSPLEYFVKIQKNLGNHAHLFSGLCQMANIPCMIISGMNKSAAYEIGKKVDRKSMGAQWNAVYVKDSWRFVDAFWASACVVGRKSGEWTLVDSDGNVTEEDQEPADGTTQHRTNEFYFLPDPDQFIWTHYPDEKPWQLLTKTISVKEFEEHFYVRERFHILGMKLIPSSYPKCIVNTSEGELDLPFSLPEDKSENFRFKYMLYKSRKALDRGSAVDAFLDRFVFFEHAAKMVHFALRFPVSGTFKMDVYGLDMREADIFDLVCTYLIVCPEAKKNCLPLPDCPPIGWGPSGATKKAGLKPLTHDRALIETKDGKVDIRFATTKSVQVQLHQNLKHAVIDEATLSKYCLIRQEGKESLVSLRLPQRGEYALKLFAQNEGKEGDAPNVCNYLIKCEGTDSSVKPFPNFSEGVLGKNYISDKLGVKAISHPGGIIEAKDGKASVTFSADSGTELICELHTNDPSAAKRMAVATKNKNGEWTFDMDLPKAGEYSLNVFALPNGNNNRVYNAHSYLISSTGQPGADDTADTSDGGSESGQKQILDIPTETVETSDGEVIIPVPPGCRKAVAAVHRRNANDPPSTEQIQFITQDDMNLVKVDLKEYGEYMLNLYDVDEGGTVRNVAKYQINRKRPGELYNTNLKTIMETLKAENSGLQVSTSRQVAMTPDPYREAEEMEKKSKEGRRKHAIRQIQRAIDLKDERQLEAALEIYLETEPPENDNLLKKARKYLKVFQAKADLMEASQKRDLPALEAAIKAAKELNADHQLDLQIALASRLRDHLLKVEKLRHAVLNMEQKTISELRTYSKPPDGVHQCMSATFLLLGGKQKELKNWRNVQILMGKTGKESLMRKVSTFQPKDVSLKASNAAKKILEPISREAIRDASAGAATFYVWSKGMIEEVESYGGAEANDNQLRLQN